MRAYLSPQYTCSGSLNDGLNCSLPPGSYFPDNTVNNPDYTYFLVRDSQTGCAYTAAAVTNLNMLATGSPVSPQFLAESPQWQNNNQMTLHTDASQWTPQLCYADGDPAPTGFSPLPFANRAVWTRTPDHVAGQAPDDAYLSAAISATDLENIINNVAPTCQQAQSGSSPGCAIRIRFQLPQTPTNVPCQPNGSASNCPLPQSQSPDPLRYMSLTFGYLPGGTTSMIADIDGQNPAIGPDSYSIVSLADTAFSLAENPNNTSGYITLIVNVTANLIQYNAAPNPNTPVGIAYNTSATISGSSGTYTVSSNKSLQGAGPVQPLTNHIEVSPGNPQRKQPYYTAWANTVKQNSQIIGDPYIVLDLTQFGDFWDTTQSDDLNSVCTLNSGSVKCNSPLIFTLRSTMPAPSFTCSAFNVPYSTAEYTDSDSLGGGFMGPYVPLVDYVAVGSLTNATQTNCGNGQAPCPAQLPPPPALTSIDLPSVGSCGKFPLSVFPSNNGATGPGSTNQSKFPVQYWPTPTSTSPPNLNCPAPNSNSDDSAFQPKISFVATQFTTQVRQTTQAGPPYHCQNRDTTGNPNACVQIIEQATQQEVNTYQPPLPLTIVGKGFGYLSGLPWAGTNPQYVQVTDTTAGWSTADSTTCQVYISDWTDSSISLSVGLPVQQFNAAGTPLFPLMDMNPLSFFQLTSNTVYCPVAANDYITVTVKNPQQIGNLTTTPLIQVAVAGTPL